MVVGEVVDVFDILTDVVYDTLELELTLMLGDAIKVTLLSCPIDK